MGQQYEVDIYARQLHLEQEMAEMGRQLVEARTRKRIAAGNESETTYGRVLVASMTDAVAEGISEFIEHTKTGGSGRRATAARDIEKLDPATAAYLTVRCVAQRLSADCPMVQMVLAIGSAIEDELHFEGLRAEDEGLYKYAKEQAKKRQRYSNKVLYVTHLARNKGHGWDGWTRSRRIHVGTKLLDIVLERTNLVQTNSVAVLKRGRPARDLTVVATPETKEWIAKRRDLDALMRPHFMPMLVRPLPWSGMYGGGYLTAAARPLRLVKTGRKAVAKAVDAAEMPGVYASINAMQDTRWAINKPVLNVINTLYDSGARWTDLPAGEDLPIPPKPHDIAENEEARRLWRREAATVHRANMDSITSRISFNMARNMANKFADEEAIHFPYQLDFRGRSYAVPMLNPQGPDWMKAVLHFADTKCLGADGYRWLLVHGANLVGVDKVPFEERCRFIEDNEEEILAIANDPYSVRSWISGFAQGSTYEKTKGEGLEVDSPWQFLAFCFEYSQLIEWIKAGCALEDFPSSIPVAMDGSCSGIQHYSMALRDPVGGAAVNLVPAERPADIYQQVADHVIAAVQHDAYTCGPDDPEWGYAKAWLEYGISRKTVKRPVMVTPYGSGRFGYRMQTVEDIMRPLKRKQGNCLPFENTGAREADYLAAKIEEALPKVVRAATDGMRYLRAVSRVVSKEGKELRWTTPLGFPVWQAKWKQKASRVETMLCGRRMALQIHEDTKEVDRNKQANGLPPNFIHALDASHMHVTLNYCLEDGMTHFAPIHDSFGTHAGDAELMYRNVRLAFRNLYHDRDVIADFTEEVRLCLSDEGREKLAEVVEDQALTKGDLDVNSVLESRYAFA